MVKPVAEELPRRQVISISEIGEMSGLQRKDGDGVDLRQFGRAQIQRASDICWMEMPQMWAIRVLEGAHAGVLTLAEFTRATGMRTLKGAAVSTAETAPGVLLFYKYEEAVLAEVFYLDAVRIGS